MLKNLFKNYIYPIATLVGGIVGVGFLSLPYIALQVGTPVMIFYFVVLTAFIVFIHEIFVKISLQTPDHKRWPGFVGFYFGPWAKKIVLCLMVSGICGVMLAYIIVGGQFLATLLQPLFGQSSALYSVMYFMLASIFIYSGTKLISWIDFLALSSLLVIMLLILVKGFSHININHFFLSAPGLSDAKTLFLPYGAIMFSLWGTGLIPSVEEMISQNKRALKTVVIWGTLIPALFYALFTFLILSITGPATSSSALTGLMHVLPGQVAMIAILIGVISTFVALVALGLLLKEILMYDVGFSPKISWSVVFFVPLILFFLGLNSFISLISFVGGFLLPIDGILILMMYLKIGGKKIVAIPLAIFFVLGLFYEIIYLIN